ncbi:hypothetical protein AX17_003527 [Amanita inopinata Kibby_2008]|nr:hypothetical protein AX17_003527 [Amanita inopinata Kibby_2008]
MSSWYSSWLPGLPSLNFPIPSSFQGRFVSFLLKKCLGHFLKPGQLDARQIESQIGSGFVQVNDLELNNEVCSPSPRSQSSDQTTQAINSILVGLPLQLRDGYISSVTARIPWPNPLSSSFGLSLDALHLTIHVVPISPAPQTADIANSVASVAETFLHEELTEQENTALRESIHSDDVHNEDNVIPGGLDPFASNLGDEAPHPDFEPVGVSLFTTLIEKLLARFEFSAINTKITLVHPGNMSLTLSIAEIRYGTEVKESADAPHDQTAKTDRHTLTIKDFTVTARKLCSSSPGRHSPRMPVNRSPSASPLLSPLLRPFPCSPLTSSSTSFSSLDEAAILHSPLRTSYISESATSSLYQSAASDELGQGQRLVSVDVCPSTHAGVVTDYDRNTCLETTDRNSHNQEPSPERDSVLLSFGTTPVVVQLTPTPSGGNASSSTPSPLDNGLNITVNVGIISLALYAWQLAGIIAMLDSSTKSAVIETQSHTITKVQVKPSPRMLSKRPMWMCDAHIGGLVILLLPAVSRPADCDSLLAEFFTEPLMTPRLSPGYIRFNIGSIDASATSTGALYETQTSEKGALMPANIFNSSVTCVDINAIIYSLSEDNSAMFISPVFFPDQRLTSQYLMPRLHPGSAVDHVQLPTFSLNMWSPTQCQGNGIEFSSQNLRKRFGITGDDPQVMSTTKQQEPAIALSTETVAATVTTSRGSQRQVLKNETLVSIVPIYIFMNVEQLIGNNCLDAFLDEFRKHTNDVSEVNTLDPEPQNESSSVVHDCKDTPPCVVGMPRNLGNEKKQSEDIVLVHPMNKRKLAMEEHGTMNHPQPNVAVKFQMVRVQLRCSFPDRPTRSGLVVADFHHLNLGSGKYPMQHDARFARFECEPNSNISSSIDLMDIKCDHVLFAHSAIGETVATTLAVLTSLHDFHDKETQGDDHEAKGPALQPHILVRKSFPSEDAVPVIVPDINIPFIYLNLSKEALDGLLFWADDAAQLAERTGRSQNSTHARHVNPVTGYRAVDTTSGNAPRREEGKPVHIHLSATEVVVRLMVPRSDEVEGIARPFDVLVSDLAISIILKPESESTMKVTAMELSIKSAATTETQTILSLATPRSLLSVPTPVLDLTFASLLLPLLEAKETRLKLALWGITCNIFSDTRWIEDVKTFVKSPPGVFESVIPSERTSIYLKVRESSLCVFAPSCPGSLVLHVGDLELGTDVVGNASESIFHLLIPTLSLLAIDDVSCCENTEVVSKYSGISYWKAMGYALITEIATLDLSYRSNLSEIPDTLVAIESINLRIHLCADTVMAVTAFISDWQQTLQPQETKEKPAPRREPAIVSGRLTQPNLLSSVEEFAFRRLPEIGPAPDMINDDLPTNLDYLDESFSAAAGLRELCDEDLDDFNYDDDFEGGSGSSTGTNVTGVISRIGGETVKMMRSDNIQVVENYFDSLPAEETLRFGDTALRIRIYDSNVTILLYDGFDWLKTRKTIEREVKDMRRRLAKLRQLVASGQSQDPNVEETSAVLFNSVYIGLDQDVDALEPGALIAAIDEQLNEDAETASQSSWQSLRPPVSGRPRPRSIRIHGKRLTRSKASSMEFVLTNLKAEIDHYRPLDALVSRTFFTVKDVEILDHIRTSTWKKFLTGLQLDAHGNTRETDSNMVRVELRNVRPVPGHPSEEVRLRAKILPLRLYVDQDAVDFLKKFFSFKDPNLSPSIDDNTDTYIQLAEIFPVDLKLDYKPRRVDYRALREGRTIELMNFFHFDGAEMTLRHITLVGITGWSKLFELLNDLWTPDVKATQLVDVISGVAPIRSVVNVGSGVADLVLLPIAQYKKDGRILRGMQKGATAFFKSTALEAIKLGAKLATGTQVILEQAEDMLGGQLTEPIADEALHVIDDVAEMPHGDSDDGGASDIISKYADQPTNIKEGVQSAYRSLQKNFSSAAQTILAIPMEVYERSDEGPARSVIRAVPIAVLRPMIGATEAVSKTLLGLHNTLDSNVRHDNEAKYKHR